MPITLDGIKGVKMEAHLWPPKSESPHYKLPGGANKRQGFYFYRNDRLIQAGGWNGLRETEPHSSLARLAIDLQSDADVFLSLDVKKVSLQLPPDFFNSIDKAKGRNGITFNKYLKDANNLYRKHNKPSFKEMPIVPGEGLTKTLQKEAKAIFGENTAKVRKIDFKWKALGKKIIFEIDNEEDIIYLNKLYRKKILNHSKASSADAPLTKLMLFLLLKDILKRERISKKYRQLMDKYNKSLFLALKGMK